MVREPNANGGGTGEGGGLFPVRELKSQKSLRRQLQRWRSSGWIFTHQENVNLDDSQPGVGRWRTRLKRCLLGVLALLGCGGVALGVVMGIDGVHLLPCLNTHSTCISLSTVVFKDVCHFDALPFHLVAEAKLPKLMSKLHVQASVMEVVSKATGRILATSGFKKEDVIGSRVLAGGPSQNLTVNSIVHVRDHSALAGMIANLLNEVDQQIVINSRLKVKLETPVPYLSFSLWTKNKFFLTCGHVPCQEDVCKYICQFADYPLVDPDRDSVFPYTTQIERIRLGTGPTGEYTITPNVYVWLRNFRTQVTFPQTLMNLYYYPTINKRNNRASRLMSELDDDHKLFRLLLRGFDLKSVEASDGMPFQLDMDLVPYVDTPEQRLNAGDLTRRFLRREPMYFYMAVSPDNPTCSNLTKALMTADPAVLSLNTNATTKDGSDATLHSLGLLPDVFKINSLDLFSVNNSKLSSFVNITLMLPFSIEGDLPAMHVNGVSENATLGTFSSFPTYIPPAPRIFPGKHATVENSKVNIVMFTNAQLTPYGLNQLHTIFPNTIASLEALNITLVGAPWDGSSVMQAFLTNVTLQLSSLEKNLVSHETRGNPQKLFLPPKEAMHKPRVHLEIRPIEQQHDAGLMAYVNFTYADAFQGAFTVRGGSMRFLVADKTHQTLASVSVLNLRLAREQTHVEAEVYIANWQQAKSIRQLMAAYTNEEPVVIRVVNGTIDAARYFKERVPMSVDPIKDKCQVEIALYCADETDKGLRECLNRVIGAKVFTHDCLDLLLPRGFMDLELSDVRDIVGIGRDVAQDVLHRLDESGARVSVNMVEVLSLRTPGQPVDLQVLFEDKLERAPNGTMLDVTARTNLTLGLLDLVDLTYIMPPLSVAMSASLTEAQVARNETTELFTVSVPEMVKDKVSGPLVVDTGVNIENFYQSAIWLEQLIADLKEKWIYAEPVDKGDIWSYMVQPLRFKVNVLQAINFTETGTANTTDGGLLSTVNDTWSKIYFDLKNKEDKVSVKTVLAFARPWIEALNVRVYPFLLNVSVISVEAGQLTSGVMTPLDRCKDDIAPCRIADFYSDLFETAKGKKVVVSTALNITATDDGTFFGHLLSDYVAGAKVGLLLESKDSEVYASKGIQNFFLDAKLILPRLPPFSLPMEDLVAEVDQVMNLSRRRRTQTSNDADTPDVEINEVQEDHTTLGLRNALSPRQPHPPPALSTQAHGQRRRLSLSEVWASLDPIILAVTQPLTVKVRDLQFVSIDTEPIDLNNLNAAHVGADVLASVIIGLPETLDVDIDAPPLSLDIHSGTLEDLLRGEQSGQPHLPWASTSIETFVYVSNKSNVATPLVHLDLLQLETALDMVDTLFGAKGNISMTLAGNKLKAGQGSNLGSRIFSHFKLQLDLITNKPRQNNSSTGSTESTTANKASATGRKRVRVSAGVTSTNQALRVNGSFHVPETTNPMRMTILMGSIDANVTTSHTDKDIGRITADSVQVTRDRDAETGFRFNLPNAALLGLLNISTALRAHKPLLISVQGSISDPVHPGHINASVLITPELLERLDIFTDPTGALLRLSASSLTSPKLPFRIDNVGIIGGVTVGSTVDIPCLVKGWCDPPTKNDTVKGPITLTAMAMATLTDLTELGVPDWVGLDVALPAMHFKLAADNVTTDLGGVSIAPFKIEVDNGKVVAVVAKATITDANGLQQLAFSMWEKDSTLRIVGDFMAGDLLSVIMSTLPIVVDVPAPSNPAERVTTFRTFPTVCENTWKLISTSASGFTTRVQLPKITTPVPITLQDFAATVYYKNTAVIKLTAPNGSFSVSPQGGGDVMHMTTLSDPRRAEGGGKFQTGYTCPYKARFPELCVLGEALGKIMTFGDSGPFEATVAITFKNPKPDSGGMTQTLRMPISAFTVPLIGATAGNDTYDTHGSTNGDPKRPLTCHHANEMVQDLYVETGDTLASSWRFWRGVKVAMRVYIVNVFVFPLDVSHMLLNMYFRDPDGAPGDDRRPAMMRFPPSPDYNLLHDADVPTPGYVIPPGKGVWSPVIEPSLDQDHLTESLARLFDEMVAHNRLCQDLLGTVMGIRLRANPQDPVFEFDLPVTIRNIPLFSPAACSTPMKEPAKQVDVDVDSSGDVHM